MVIPLCLPLSIVLCFPYSLHSSFAAHPNINSTIFMYLAELIAAHRLEASKLRRA